MNTIELAPPMSDTARPHNETVANEHAGVEAACEQACEAIAPAWPLDRSIAVNPHWSRIRMPVRTVAARMAVFGRIQVFAPRTLQRQAWQEGRIQATDLAHALAMLPAGDAAAWTLDRLVAVLDTTPRTHQLPLLIDILDNDARRNTRLSWRQAITHQISQTCAAYFDMQQAEWQPERNQGLYAFWRDTLSHDHGIGTLMGLPKLGKALGALPATREAAERWAMERLHLAPSLWADYLEAVLLTINGWASWCSYLRWQAQQEGRVDLHLRDLLAIRLAWGAVLLDGKDDADTRQAFGVLHRAWRQAPSLLAQCEQELLADEIWQSALEIGYQRQLSERLAAAGPAPDSRQNIQAQAVFCIDVRSEPLRRALEATWPAVQTFGYAGFFGLPMAYTPLGTAMRRPQLPGLLPASLDVAEQIITAENAHAGQDAAAQDAARRARQNRLALSQQWQSASRWPGAAFSFVEAAGVGYLAKLGQWLRPSDSPRVNDDLAGLPARLRPLCRPTLQGLGTDAKVALAARVLRGMGLDREFAPLVVFVGHGSQTRNNAQASALDCGACCGQTGEANARSLARLLNEASVRAGLVQQGIVIPADTRFVGALHNTTTDEIEGFDLDLLEPAARARYDALDAALHRAGDQVRRERAPRLGIAPRDGHDPLLRQFRRRANDGAQNRPEWGLTGNAAFLIAPRWRSRGITLEGRCFLHDYDASRDPQGALLEQLMTAPMLVTHWINWQYHASTCDPERLGSGNKLLHNVVGGVIGVFEGNGGDLRIGLSRQSLHDGARWVHEPLRLTVAIDAPAAAIERVMGSHVAVRQLIDNGWLHLWRWASDGLMERYAQGRWHALPWR
ncbi:MAG: YbcC family protein [Bordetella sp.]|uniref:YbcC family protein n=1 Tax=Bordetella sp. TaxID=28081 RepID=UPI003F7C22C7